MNIKMPALPMTADAYVIKNPYETKNAFTKTDIDSAAAPLRLVDAVSADEFKRLLRGYDFTFISTNELKAIASLLQERELADVYVMDFLMLGNMAFDKYGRQAQMDVKFNAVAMFSQMLDERMVCRKKWVENTSLESFDQITQGLVKVNHLMGALSYFVGSDQSNLSISYSV
ncbi:hypothetical protein SAMN04487857_11578 [Pseudomonas sp. ok272]|uniref:hypothetical protein n=1 Tax=unclassified Pseudomonas TaxID=196821 RepID=UPI0008AFF77B|nr:MULTISPECIES: hypothetical protein [unclassified Pseudomonas]SEN39429.1 hypothetical protein SAMN04487857_11578 [Pseudomonas sp. ok272]SFN23338.1 hypothetical protein SAMN04487858_11578 [Pseudomonas sp. ok602]